MFGLFKKKTGLAAEPGVSAAGWMRLSEDEELIDRVDEYTYTKLDRLKVDLEKRVFIWKATEPLTIEQLSQRLHSKNTVMPQELVEASVINWLEEAYMPDDIEDGDEEQAAMDAIEMWIDEYYQNQSS